ncbi:ribosome-inactivating family protein [Burkholderia sp. MR1-5-21]
MHHMLRVAPDWSTQIARIRNDISEDTNLIRFDNTFYRVCRAGGSFAIMLMPQSGAGGGLTLTMRMKDVYVETIGGQPITQYAATLDKAAPNAFALDEAIYKLAPRASARLSTDERFAAQSIIVFCVAESLRFSHVATAVGQAILASHGQLRGASGRLGLDTWMPLVKNWGNASEAIFGVMSDRARAIALQPRAMLSEDDRRFSEQVNTASLPGRLPEFARSVTLLKRP